MSGAVVLYTDQRGPRARGRPRTRPCSIFFICAARASYSLPSLPLSAPPSGRTGALSISATPASVALRRGDRVRVHFHRPFRSLRSVRWGPPTLQRAPSRLPLRASLPPPHGWRRPSPGPPAVGRSGSPPAPLPLPPPPHRPPVPHPPRPRRRRRHAATIPPMRTASLTQTRGRCRCGRRARAPRRRPAGWPCRGGRPPTGGRWWGCWPPPPTGCWRRSIEAGICRAARRLREAGVFLSTSSADGGWELLRSLRLRRREW